MTLLETSVLPPPPAPLVIGVSGGGDSMALLHMAHEAGFRCRAVTVNHGLRAEANDEAAFVARVCRDLGVLHETVEGNDPPATGRPAWARNLRLRTLVDRAQAANATIALAHNADDQVETLRMRAARGGGTLGLSGIPLLARLDGRLLVRPLLECRRDALRRWLGERGLEWIEDPSNTDTAYERNRRRMSASTLDDANILRLATLARRHRAALMQRAARHIENDLTVDHSVWTFAVDHLHAPALLTLRIVIASAGGGRHLPSEPTLLRLLDEDAFTLGHCIVRRVGNTYRVRRENRGPSDERRIGDDCLPWLEGPVPQSDWRIEEALRAKLDVRDGEEPSGARAPRSRSEGSQDPTA